MTIVIPIAGVIIDRWNRKRIIVVVDSLQAFITLLIIFLFYFEMTEPILIILINGLLGLFQGFHIPTVTAIVPTMVPKDKLNRINGVNFLFTSFIQFIAPIISATLLSFFPIKIILLIDPITFIIAFIPLLLIKIPKIRTVITSDKKKSFIEDFKIGLLTLKLIPIVFMMLLVAFFVNFFMRPLFILMPYFIKFTHSGSASDLAFFLAFLNGGMLLGAFIASIKKNWKHSTFIYFGGELTLMATYGIIAISPHGFFLFMGIAAVIFGLTIPIINTIYLTTMQIKVPSDKMGRITSIDYAISLALTPIATIIAGPLAELFGVANLFLYCAILGSIITIILWYFAHTRINNNKMKEPEKLD